MIFNFEPTRITKQLLLDRYTEEEYMSFYLGIMPDKELHRNPLRTDSHPTASFYRSKNMNGELIFKDFSTGQHLNFVDVVMEKYKVNFNRALRIIANDFGIITKANFERNERQVEYDGTVIKEKTDTVIQCEIRDYTPEELQWWLDFGITEATLKKFHVFAVKSVFLNGNYIMSSSPSNPVYGYYFGKDEGRELWKIYFPLKTTFRFLLNTNVLQGTRQLPKTGDVVVVTKSLKDVMALHEMGIAAVAPQAESVIISSRQYAALSKRFGTVIVNGDWDKAGQKFMAESRRRYRCLCMSFTDKRKYGKDVSDFVKKYGFEKAQKFFKKTRLAFDKGTFDYQYSRCKAEI